MHRNTAGEETRRFPGIRRMLKKPPALLVAMLSIYLNFLFQVSNYFITKQTRDSNLENEMT